jgi:hypothetical protein
MVCIENRPGTQIADASQIRDNAAWNGPILDDRRSK